MVQGIPASGGNLQAELQKISFVALLVMSMRKRLPHTTFNLVRPVGGVKEDGEEEGEEERQRERRIERGINVPTGHEALRIQSYSVQNRRIRTPVPTGDDSEGM